MMRGRSTIPKQVERIARDGSSTLVAREWVPEVPVALEFNGLSYAVMMATPSDLADFATGFAICEGLARNAGEVGSVDIAETGQGWIVRAQLSGLGIDKLQDRVRTRVAESSCGLCGIENLEALAAPLPRVANHDAIETSAIFRALDELPTHQPLGSATGAAHAAALADTDGAIWLAREDVGRHNALDKLVGAAGRRGLDMAAGFILSTARCSYEIVEKTVRSGGTRLVTISLPTSMANSRAREAGLTLYALARSDSILAICDRSEQ